MSIVGCYSLDLYCENDSYCEKRGKDGIHNYREFPHTYTHEFGSTCRKTARKDGWKLTKEGKAYCPKCTGRSKK